MPIFIVADNPGLKAPVALTDADTHHLTRVMRVRVGETVTLTDNQGTLATAEIASLKPLALTVTNLGAGPKPFPVTAHLPLIDAERLEWAVEKLCELNLAAIQLVVTARTQLQNLSPAKMKRLEKIAVTAQKQSGRCYPLEIFAACPLAKIDWKKFRMIFVGSDREKISPLSILPTRLSPLALVVGPEGGFTDEEIQSFPQGSFFRQIGNTTLRSETAAVALSSMLLTTLENFA